MENYFSADNIGTSTIKTILTTVKDDVEINGYKGIKNKGR